MKIRHNDWWSRRSTLEKRLVISSVILFSVSIILTSILVFLDVSHDLMEFYMSDKKHVLDSNVVRVLGDRRRDKNVGKINNKQEYEVCLTPTCVGAAHTFINNIDESISPCDDFYRFSCGQWLNNSMIPDNRLSISTTGVIVEAMENQFKVLVEEPTKPEDLVVFKNIKKMYNSCMNLSQLMRLGDDPLIGILSSLGGWPVVEGSLWKSDSFDWIDTNLKMRELGLPFNEFYHISVGLDIKNNTKHLITIGEVMPGVGDRNVMLRGLDEPNVKAYYELLVESALLLGGVKHFNSNPFNEIKELINFQIQIVNWTRPQEESRNVSELYNKMTVKDLQLIAPNTKWIRLLSGIFRQTIHPSDEVIVNNPNYVKQIDRMLILTDKRVLANHMIADVILSSLPLLHPKWLQLYDLYSHRITGRKAVPPRWHVCTKSAASLTTAFSALYVRKYFHKESKHKVEEMVNFIHKEFIEMLNSVEWMDETTKEKALDKAKAITSYIGFPKQLLNDSQIRQIYENLEEFTDDQYFKNTLKLSKWLTDYSMQSLTQKRLKGDWRNFAETTIVNAYYSAIENAIIFPAGILRGMFFNYNNPNYMNFGAIGTVIAHEITHAFDDIGKQFDKYGNNKNWWHSTTDTMFKNRTQCLINQYNSYVLPDIATNLNGRNTLGENIADNVGVREAFKAYKSYVKQHPKELTLPGLKYTPEQLFWITYGNVWCTQVRPEVSKMFVDKETHSPARFRVIGTLSNLKEFSQSFNCPEGSQMNPLNKCNIW